MINVLTKHFFPFYPYVSCSASTAHFGYVAKQKKEIRDLQIYIHMCAALTQTFAYSVARPSVHPFVYFVRKLKQHKQQQLIFKLDLVGGFSQLDYIFCPKQLKDTQK